MSDEKKGCTLRDVCDGRGESTAPRSEPGDEVKMWSAASEKDSLLVSLGRQVERAEAAEAALSTARIDGARAFAEWLDVGAGDGSTDFRDLVETFARWLAEKEGK